MTGERRLIFDLSDIKTVIYECGDCHGRLAVPVDLTIHGDKMVHCTYCNKSWFSDYTKASPYQGILEAIQKVKQLEAAGAVPFSTRLEFDEPITP